MGHVLQQPVIERHIITKQGELEVTVNLNLTITLGSDGALQLAVTSASDASVPAAVKRKTEVEKVKREVPDLEPTSGLIDFGKSV